MQPLEKLIFLELTNKQFVKLPNKDYFDTYAELNEQQKQCFSKVSKEIHDIWTHINMDSIPGVFTKSADSIDEYHNVVSPISSEILSVVRDFSITLKREMNPDFKKAFIKIFGQGKFDRLFGKEQ